MQQVVTCLTSFAVFSIIKVNSMIVRMGFMYYDPDYYTRVKYFYIVTFMDKPKKYKKEKEDV